MSTSGSQSQPIATQTANHRWLPWVVRIVALLSLVLILYVVVSFTMNDRPAKTKNTQMTHTITRNDLIVTVTEQGTLESSNNTEIKCKIRGFHTVTWVVEVGTIVKQGDELVRLDTKVLEENKSLGETNKNTAEATLERTKADVRKAEIALEAYRKKNGRFDAQLKTIDEAIEIAQKRLITSREILEDTKKLYAKGFVNGFELEADRFVVTQNQLELQLQQNQRQVLINYTKKMQLATLEGELDASQTKLKSDQANRDMEVFKLNRAIAELESSIIRAPKDGLVIYPSAAEWKETPDITEGATVRKDQTLLLMPDLKKMQIKVGVHESVVDNMEVGCEAIVRIGERVLRSKVSRIANVTKPAGWWTGNVVKYDTIIELPEEDNLKPGMSAEIEIVLAEHRNVTTIPVAAVLETEDGSFCWVDTEEGPIKRSLELGDSNDVFIQVKDGVTEGEKVILNPLAFVDEAQQEAQRLFVDAAM